MSHAKKREMIAEIEHRRELEKQGITLEMQEEARRRIEEENNRLCDYHLKDNFKQYVKEKY